MGGIQNNAIRAIITTRHIPCSNTLTVETKSCGVPALAYPTIKHPIRIRVKYNNLLRKYLRARGVI